VFAPTELVSQTLEVPQGLESEPCIAIPENALRESIQVLEEALEEVPGGK